MRLRHLLIVLLLAVLALAACARQAPRYAVAPADGIAALELDVRMYGAPQPASYAVRRVAQVVPVAASLRGRPLHARQRRQAPHRGVRPGHAVQQLHRRRAGAVTMPLIGAVEARGLTTAQLAGAIAGRLRSGYHPRSERRGRDRDLPAVLRARRGHLPGPVSLRAEHDGRERHRHRRRLHAARLQGQGHHHPQDAGHADPLRAAAALSAAPRRHHQVSERWF